jgi:hypothetical protein
MNKTKEVQSPGAFAWGNLDGFTFVESGRDKKEPRLYFTVCKEVQTGDFYRIWYFNKMEDKDDDGCWYFTNEIHQVELKEVEQVIKVKEWISTND